MYSYRLPVSIYTILLFCLISMAPGCCGEDKLSPSFQALSDAVDWQTQDYQDSRGITSVKIDKTGKENRLVLDAHLIGEDQQYSKGEVFIDLRYTPGLEGSTPFDLRKTKIAVQVDVPAGFAGTERRPNGIQVFVKDDEWKSQYGAWLNVTRGSKYEAILSPSKKQISMGYTDPKFNPEKVRVIGVKFAIGDGSALRYNGPLYITKVEITPNFLLTPPPPLPTSMPRLTFIPQNMKDLEKREFDNGKRMFLIGANWRMLEYGQNFGSTLWFPGGNGVSKHQNFVRAHLQQMQRTGIRLIRVGLLDDGRTMFDQEGNVTGYNAIFKNDVRLLLEMAMKANIKVEFVLFDFLIAGKPECIDRVWLRGRSKIIIDKTIRNSFLEKFLVPFLREFGNHPAFFGFDIINEPEWIVSKINDNGDYESVTDMTTKALSPIPGKAMHEFLNACVAVIRLHAPDKFITVGISCKFIPLLNDVDVDYYALHHYPWMDENGAPLHAFDKYLSKLPAGKRWMLEEFPTNDTNIGVREYLSGVWESGGIGAMLWNFSPGIDDRTFEYDMQDTILMKLRGWIDEQAQKIH